MTTYLFPYKQPHVHENSPMYMKIALCIWKQPYVHENSLMERWGAGVEYHFQEISWNLRPAVNGT